LREGVGKHRRGACLKEKVAKRRGHRGRIGDQRDVGDHEDCAAVKVCIRKTGGPSVILEENSRAIPTLFSKDPVRERWG